VLGTADKVQCAQGLLRTHARGADVSNDHGLGIASQGVLQPKQSSATSPLHLEYNLGFSRGKKIQIGLGMGVRKQYATADTSIPIVCSDISWVLRPTS
jgi:hypothetical protein